MAVTNNVLNAINVFSSTSVFNSNKGSVGANDLNFIKQTTAELATEGGGIIAQSLGTNGYVKFANGLILQWGYCNGKASNISFPLAFATINYIILPSQQTPSAQAYNGNQVWISKATTTANVFFHSNGSARIDYVVIGYQQWGVTEQISGNASKIVNFPLAYTTFSHWVANSRSSSTNESSWCTGGYDGTLTGFTARSNGTPIEWIATGLQQWSVTAITHPIKWTFSISFSSNPYFIGSIKQGKNNNWTPSYPVSIGSFTKTYVNVRPLETVSADDKLLYNFAIGY